MTRVLYLAIVLVLYFPSDLLCRQLPAQTAATIVVICNAGNEECLVRLDDVAEERTTQKQIRFADVAAGPHVIILSAEGFADQSVLVNVTAGDVRTVGPNSLTPKLRGVSNAEEVFKSIVSAVGQESDPNLTHAIQIEATSTIKHKFEGNSTVEVQDKVTYVESFFAGKWVRWDVTVLPNMRLMLATTLNELSAQVSMEADPLARRLAIPADLKRTFAALQHLRLTELLPLLNRPSYVKELPNPEDRILTVTGLDGVFDITYDEKFIPVRIEYKPAGGFPSVEISYADYGKVGNWTLPFLLAVRFSDVPSFTQEIHNLKYYLGADLRETDLTKFKYNLKYKGYIGIGMWRGRDTKCFSEVGAEVGECRHN